jgi:hypothetical protein
MTRLIFSLVGGAVVLAVLGGVYASWSSSIRAEALASYNRTQLEQSVKDLKLSNDQLRRINLEAAEIARKLEDENQELEKKLSGIEDFINKNPSTGGSSEILKQTVRKLSGR